MRLFGLLLLFLAAAAVRARAETVDGGRYGPVRLGLPSGEVRGYVLVFSDAGGWTADDDRTLDGIAKLGAVAVGVDTKLYLASIARKTEGGVCVNLVGDVEVISRQIQRLHPAPQYVFPMVAGVGQGGTVAYAASMQAPVNTLSGAVALDPQRLIRTALPPCPASFSTSDGQGGFLLGNAGRPQGFLAVGLNGAALPPDASYYRSLQSGGSDINVETVPGQDASATLVSLVDLHLSGAPPAGIASFPLIPLPTGKPSTMMAVMLSGDGGWRDLDKVIAEQLQSMGVSVVGWDCLRYFWQEKTPDQTAADLAQVLTFYGRLWNSDDIALIGYSFGADVLPSLYNRLPTELRSRIKLVSLLGLGAKADWEITVTGWLGAPPGERATPTAPELARMPAGLVQCFYGEEESESACPSLAANAELIRTSGGHHFGHGYDAITREIISGFRQRSRS